MSDYSKLFTGQASSPQAPASHLTPPRYRLLFVDDESGIVKALTRVFRQENYQIVTAASGSEGLQRLAEATTHLVISDFMMPGMTGAEVAATLRNERPDLPLLFVTGYSESDAIRTAAPDAAVMTKPFRPEALDIAVRDVMRQRKENPA